MANLIDPCVIVNDATTAEATLKIVNDSYDVYHPVTNITDGINSPIPVLGVPYWTRWIDIEVYTAAKRADLQTKLMNSYGFVTIGEDTGYLVTSNSCSESVFVGDLNPVQVWKYHIEFFKAAVKKSGSTGGAVISGHNILVE